MRLNVRASSTLRTHEGAPAHPATISRPDLALRRSVMSCLLWEKEFYEDGQAIADRITELAGKCAPEVVAQIAVEARNTHGLRHVPLLLVCSLVSTHGWGGVSRTVDTVIQRADEITELVAMYWRNGKRPLDHQLKKGLRDAFDKFDEYQLAKYDRDGVVKLRDVMRMVRPKPSSPEQAALWKKVIDRTLETPDTWEVELSSGKGKRETFERLLREGKLGYMALLRNLRNMAEADVDRHLVQDAILARKGSRWVLPHRYVAAARAVPAWEPWVDQALQATIQEMEPLTGRTYVLVDVSGSMDHKLSAKSDLRRMDAAAALAAIIPGEVRMFSFSDALVEVPPRRGMAGIDAILQSQRHGGTYLGRAVQNAQSQGGHDRIIVVTDEQSHDPVGDPVARHAYMINVASAKNGVGYGRWTHIDGFSESVIKYILESERATARTVD